jgi:hypothetical protein
MLLPVMRGNSRTTYGPPSAFFNAEVSWLTSARQEEQQIGSVAEQLGGSRGC